MKHEDENKIDGVDDGWVRRIVAELERAAPKEAAKIELEWPEEFEGRIVANKAGYLRLALECFNAAIAPLKPGVESTSADWSYLFTKNSSPISEVWRTEIIPLQAPPLPTTWKKIKNTIVVVSVLALLLFLAASTVVGCITILGKF